jgi:hypothetical protein
MEEMTFDGTSIVNRSKCRGERWRRVSTTVRRSHNQDRAQSDACLSNAKFQKKYSKYLEVLEVLRTVLRSWDPLIEGQTIEGFRHSRFIRLQRQRSRFSIRLIRL